jgi:hypothetical protein
MKNHTSFDEYLREKRRVDTELDDLCHWMENYEKSDEYKRYQKIKSIPLLVSVIALCLMIYIMAISKILGLTYLLLMAIGCICLMTIAFIDIILKKKHPEIIQLKKKRFHYKKELKQQINN